MAYFLAAKTAGEVVRREWPVPVDADDGASSASLSASGVTVDSNSFEGNNLVLTLSGGTAATTGSIVATITTTQGRTLVETLYVPVVASAAQVADTARSYVEFVLRKVTGIGETPEADEAADALERLNAMVAEWRAGGADIGAPYPLTLSSVIYCPDYAVRALRYNLLIDCAGLYGMEPTIDERMTAMRGLQLVKQTNVWNRRLVTDNPGDDYGMRLAASDGVLYY